MSHYCIIIVFVVVIIIIIIIVIKLARKKHVIQEQCTHGRGQSHMIYFNFIFEPFSTWEMGKLCTSISCSFSGLTENAEHDNDGQRKSRDRKTA